MQTIEQSGSQRRDVVGKPGNLLGQSIDTMAGSVLLILVLLVVEEVPEMGIVPR